MTGPGDFRTFTYIAPASPGHPEMGAVHITESRELLAELLVRDGADHAATDYALASIERHPDRWHLRYELRR